MRWYTKTPNETRPENTRLDEIKRSHTGHVAAVQPFPSRSKAGAEAAGLAGYLWSRLSH